VVFFGAAGVGAAVGSAVGVTVLVGDMVGNAVGERIGEGEAATFVIIVSSPGGVVVLSVLPVSGAVLFLEHPMHNKMVRVINEKIILLSIIGLRHS
jgi:FixJ family two-component response regulator